MDKKCEEFLQKIKEKKALENKRVSKDEMIEIIENENLDKFGISIRF